ncbi:MAG: hypothetical protein ACAH80_05440 [Alphaproteobacteria bacterium]
MRAMSRTLMVAVCAGLLTMTAAPGSSTAFQPAVQVNAHITFVQPSTATKLSDVSMGHLRGQGYDQISLGTDGILRASGRAGEVQGQGQPSVIKISNTRDSVINFVSSNYRGGDGIGAMRAQCSLQAGGKNCMDAPVGGGARTLYIGMDMTVTDGVGLHTGASLKQPSFDMSIVYQ